MKNSIIALLLIIGLSAFAQEKKDIGKRHQRSQMEKFTPEQKTQLMVKKMTLELELNSKQQEQVAKIIAEQSSKREVVRAEHTAKREASVKPTVEERFEMKNRMLDNQIEMKAKMKKILSPEQFEKWNNLKEKHQEKRGQKRYNK